MSVGRVVACHSCVVVPAGAPMRVTVRLIVPVVCTRAVAFSIVILFTTTTIVAVASTIAILVINTIFQC